MKRKRQSATLTLRVSGEFLSRLKAWAKDMEPEVGRRVSVSDLVRASLAEHIARHEALTPKRKERR